MSISSMGLYQGCTWNGVISFKTFQIILLSVNGAVAVLRFSLTACMFTSSKGNKRIQKRYQTTSWTDFIKLKCGISAGKKGRKKRGNIFLTRAGSALDILLHNRHIRGKNANRRIFIFNLLSLINKKHLEHLNSPFSYRICFHNHINIQYSETIVITVPIWRIS